MNEKWKVQNFIGVEPAQLNQVQDLKADGYRLGGSIVR